MSISIGSVGELVSVIQAQLAARPAARAKAGGRALRSGRRDAQEQLTRLIETRIGQIGRDDPQRGRKAFRVFLEAVLLSQLGDGLVNDPRFFQMVDEVQGAMEADPACSLLIGSAIDQLLSKHP